MAVQITHIRVADPASHETITHYAWNQNGLTGTWTKAQGVSYVTAHPGDTFVNHGGRTVAVSVWQEVGKLPYLRTHADGYWNDNLLSLPRF
ncbi:DUF3892 domain-containing protein [Frondihabitans cladoniiphilus]|uniref:DUF3892 domain-containing protein n=1 Tax=Frondihabitans cladoniiphilus TaxID=715785 RepID=A0ABP8WA07_9MICO